MHLNMINPLIAAAGRDGRVDTTAYSDHSPCDVWSDSLCLRYPHSPPAFSMVTCHSSSRSTVMSGVLCYTPSLHTTWCQDRGMWMHWGPQWRTDPSLLSYSSLPQPCARTRRQGGKNTLLPTPCQPVPTNWPHALQKTLSHTRRDEVEFPLAPHAAPLPFFQVVCLQVVSCT